MGLLVPVLFGTAVAGSALVLHGSLVGAAIAVIIFILPTLVGLGDVLWYRRVEFWGEALHLARPFFPSYTVPYEEVTLIGAEAAKAGDRVIVWKLMSNAAHLTMVDQPEGYAEVVAAFLQSVEER